MSDKPTLDDAIAYFQKCVDKGSSLGEVTTLAKLKEHRDSLQARPELPGGPCFEGGRTAYRICGEITGP